MLAGVLGGACISSKRSEQEIVLGWCRGGSGLNRSSCPSTGDFIQPLLLVYLMFFPPPSRSQYSVLIRVRVLVSMQFSIDENLRNSQCKLHPPQKDGLTIPNSGDGGLCKIVCQKDCLSAWHSTSRTETPLKAILVWLMID